MEFLNENNLEEHFISDRVFTLTLKELNSSDPNESIITTLLGYMLRTKSLNKIVFLLKEIFENENVRRDIRVLSLQYLLRENPKDQLEYYSKNFESIKGKSSEIIFVKEILKWKGSNIEKIKEKISKEGSDRAQELIENNSKNIKRKEIEKEEEQEKKYNNTEIVKEISELRKKINLLAVEDNRFKFTLFPDSERIISQIEGPTKLAELMGRCMDLRVFIQDLNAEDLSKHGFSLDQARKEINGLNELSGSINLLHLYLLSKKIKVGEDLYGLRTLNNIVIRIAAHPQSEEKLSKVLKENKLSESYLKEDFQYIHKKLLEMYLNFLRSLFEKIKGSQQAV